MAGRSKVMRERVISVIGGTGLQGGGVVDALLAQGRHPLQSRP